MGIYVLGGSGGWEPGDLEDLWLFGCLPECGPLWDGVELTPSRTMAKIEQQRRDHPDKPQDVMGRGIEQTHLGRFTVAQKGNGGDKWRTLLTASLRNNPFCRYTGNVTKSK